jgi:hypothetical protein
LSRSSPKRNSAHIKELEVINLHKKANGFSIFSSFLPEGLLSHFNIVDFKELNFTKYCFYIYLDEKTFFLKILINEFESKGFYERALIQDFPIRGKLFI